MSSRKFKLYPEEELFAIEELEKKLSYRHLHSLQFEDPEEMLLKGLDQEKKGTVDPAALILGQQFHPQIDSSYIPSVSIRLVHPAVGHGLFAEESIAKNQYVGEYNGIVRQNNRRYFEHINNYCYAYPMLDDIGRNYVIDATAGSLTRFINHSFYPNLKPCYAYWKGYYHLIFLALRNIQPGEQLSYDYGESYWYLREKPLSI